MNPSYTDCRHKRMQQQAWPASDRSPVRNRMQQQAWPRIRLIARLNRMQYRRRLECNRIENSNRWNIKERQVKGKQCLRWRSDVIVCTELKERGVKECLFVCLFTYSLDRTKLMVTISIDRSIDRPNTSPSKHQQQRWHQRWSHQQQRRRQPQQQYQRRRRRITMVGWKKEKLRFIWKKWKLWRFRSLKK